MLPEILPNLGSKIIFFLKQIKSKILITHNIYLNRRKIPLAILILGPWMLFLK